MIYYVTECRRCLLRCRKRVKLSREWIMITFLIRKKWSGNWWSLTKSEEYGTSTIGCSFICKPAEIYQTQSFAGQQETFWMFPVWIIIKFAISRSGLLNCLMIGRLPLSDHQGFDTASCFVWPVSRRWYVWHCFRPAWPFYMELLNSVFVNVVFITGSYGLWWNGRARAVTWWSFMYIKQL